MVAVTHAFIGFNHGRGQVLQDDPVIVAVLAKVLPNFQFLAWGMNANPAESAADTLVFFYDSLRVTLDSNSPQAAIQYSAVADCHDVFSFR